MEEFRMSTPSIPTLLGFLGVLMFLVLAQLKAYRTAFSTKGFWLAVGCLVSWMAFHTAVTASAARASVIGKKSVRMRVA